MAQTVPFDLYLGPSKTGVALGAIVYEADGTTVYAAFSTTGWYEEPDGTGDWHHPGLSLPDAGGVVAYGVSGTEYRRYSVGAAPTPAPTVADIDTQLSNTHGNGSWETATGFATPTNVTDAQAAVQADIAALNDLSTADIDARLAAYDAPTKAELDSAVAPLATSTALATVDTVVDTILSDTGTDGVVLSTAQMQALADIVLGRSLSNIDDTAATHSLYELIQAILESSTATGNWVIKKTDGATTFNTRTITTDANALPITGVS